MNTLMDFPSFLVEKLQEKELILVKGGNIPPPKPPINNSGGRCEGTNDSDGHCSGINNSIGTCDDIR